MQVLKRYTYFYIRVSTILSYKLQQKLIIIIRHKEHIMWFSYCILYKEHNNIVKRTKEIWPKVK